MKQIISIFFACGLASLAYGQKSNPVRIGFLSDGLSSKEITAAESYLSRQKYFSWIPLSLQEVTDDYLQSHHVTHIWWLKDNQEINETQKQAGAVLKRFVAGGGHLVLSMEAVRLLNDWGIEKNTFEIKEASIVDEGYGRSLGFHGYQSHPVFQGLHGGAYIWKAYSNHVVRKIGFFGKSLPDTTIARVIGVGWSYITFHETEKLLLEYKIGKGSYIAVGAYTYFSRPNFNSLELFRFYNNIFNYTAGRIKGVKEGFWSYAGVSVRQSDEKFKACAKPVAEKWKVRTSVRPLERKKATRNFVNVAGRRLLIMAKENGGIEEVWSHPYMSFRDIETGVQTEGSDSILWLNKMVPEISVTPELITRKYGVGPDTLTEMITADVQKPVGIIHYEWGSAKILKIWVRYTSNLRYMWPYSAHSSPVMQFQWSEELNSSIVYSPHAGSVSIMSFSSQPLQYVLGQYKDFNLSNGVLSGVPTNLEQVSGMFCFNAVSAGGKFNVCMMGGSEGAGQAVKAYEKIIPAINKMPGASADYYRRLLKDQLTITTPDQKFNEGYRWATLRLDQFLQTTPGIGTSLMAGFATTASGWNGGQSVSGRPGYAWYFGRDGEWSGMALNAIGSFEKVKMVLDVFASHQAVNGKIFHELTSSGTVHYDAADATPLFVVLAGQYVRYTGDTAYVRKIWPSIKKAMDFCYSTDTDKDGLIENTNVGHGWLEGGPLYGSKTEFYLAGTWSAALDQAAYIASSLHYLALRNQYEKDGREVKRIIDQEFWSKENKHFSNGKMADGSFMPDLTILAAAPVLLGAVTDAKKAWLTTASFSKDNFTTDWGVQTVPEDNPHYSPGDYQVGMVRPLFTGYASLAEYRTGNLISGFTHLMNNAAEYRSWSLGSVHETLNGEFYRPAGICAQQAWSEAMVLLPAAEGMLGLSPDALSHRLTMAPCFPWSWRAVDASNIRIGNSIVSMKMKRLEDIYNYSFQKKGSSPLYLNFSPFLPPGTKVLKVLVNGKEVKFNQREKEEAVQVEVTSLQILGNINIKIVCSGGIGVLPLINEPREGDKNTGAKIIGQNLQKNSYRVQVEGIPGKSYQFNIFSAKPIKEVHNAVFKLSEEHIYQLTTVIPEGDKKYNSREVVVILK